MPSLRALLRPESVAIIGDTPGAGRGGWIHEQLLRLGYDGPIYPVNPKYGEIRGVKAYPSLLDIPAPVEFVAVGVGASPAPPGVQECGEEKAPRALFLGRGLCGSGLWGQASPGERWPAAPGHGDRG